MADAHAKPQHDYHIIDPSPWPALGSLGALVMAFGAVGYMQYLKGNEFHVLGLNIAGPWLLLIGLLVVLYTMFAWWSDTIKEAHEGHHTRVVSLHLRYGMIMFIASEVMFFVAWFWAFFDASLYPADVEQVARTAFTGARWLRGVYFDTPDLESYRRAATKRRLRWKVRTRSYVESGATYVEVKQRGTRGVTEKQRISLPLDSTPELLGPVSREWIDAVLGRPGLAATLDPVCATTYQRTTLVDLDSTTRATIDTSVALGGAEAAQLVTAPEVVAVVSFLVGILGLWFFLTAR